MVEHIIYHCTEEDIERKILISGISKGGMEWPYTQDQLVRRKTIKHFNKFAEAIIMKRTERGV